MGSAAAGAGGRGSSRSRGSSRWWWRPRPRRGSRPRRCPLWSWDLDKEQVSSPSSLTRGVLTMPTATLAWTPRQRDAGLCPPCWGELPDRACPKAGRPPEQQPPRRGCGVHPSPRLNSLDSNTGGLTGRAHVSNGAVSRSPPPHACSVSAPSSQNKFESPLCAPPSCHPGPQDHTAGERRTGERPERRWAWGCPCPRPAQARGGGGPGPARDDHMTVAGRPAPPGAPAPLRGRVWAESAERGRRGPAPT